MTIRHFTELGPGHGLVPNIPLHLGVHPSVFRRSEDERTRAVPTMAAGRRPLFSWASTRVGWSCARWARRSLARL